MQLLAFESEIIGAVMKMKTLFLPIKHIDEELLKARLVSSHHWIHC